MNKALIVARHEFAVTVKRVWFVVSTFVFPLVFAGIGGGMLLLSKQTVEETQREAVSKPLGLVDLSGELGADPKSFRLLRFSDEAAARSAVATREVGSALIVPADWVSTGEIRVVTGRRLTPMTSARPAVPEGVEGWLVENLLRDIDPRRRARARVPFKASVVFLDASGRPSDEDPMAALKRSGVAYVFFFLLFVSIFSSSQYLLQGMAEEKENRVMEMVLSSVTPGALMAGKLLGLGAAGLLQLLVWVGLGLTSTLFAPAIAVALEPAAFAVCFIYFLLGYLLFGSLMLGFGSLGTNLRESQQMASLWSFLGATPAFIVIALFENPQGTLARVFSFIPFTAPTTMMFRYTVDPKGTPLWEMALSILLLAGCTVLALKVSARLFRAGLLLYGKRPGLREIWRWVVQGR